MGRRYGRNQKRRDRQRIAELQIALDQETKRAEYCASFKDRHENFLREFRRWWDHCILCDPECVAMSDLPLEFRIPVIQDPLSGFSTDPYGAVIAKMTYDTLRAVEVAARRVPERMANHVLVRLPDGKTFQYYISDTEYFPQRAKEQIAFEIVRRLTD